MLDLSAAVTQLVVAVAFGETGGDDGVVNQFVAKTGIEGHWPSHRENNSAIPIGVY